MSRVILPVDHLEEVWPRRKTKPRVGALLHGASVNSRLIPTLDLLSAMDGQSISLRALFGPQHGFYGTTQDNMIESQDCVHPELDIPVFSLYGQYREPTSRMLEELDCLLIDLADVGARYYTFIWTMFLCLKACQKAGVEVVIADRPNPINGVTTEGDVQDPEFLSFVGLAPIPVRHGKTIGELARHFRDHYFPGVELTVLPAEGWERRMWHDETGLPWVMPSPNMPTPNTAAVYPGMCLLEGTNISEGRGTTRPFELFGAPWIDSADLIRKLNQLELPGVWFREAAFEPTFQKHAGNLCRGGQIHVTGRDSFLPYQTAVELINLIRRDYPSEFAWKPPPYEYEYQKLPIEILTGAPVERTFPPV